MRKKNRLNVNHMVCLMALKESDFYPSAAALELGVDCSYVTYTIKLMETYFGYPIFRRGYKKHCIEENGVLGFTQKGQNLYFSIKTFLESITLIGGDNENSPN